MIYLTGDTHGNMIRIRDFCIKKSLTKDDVLIILGDAGLNYYSDARDDYSKVLLSKLEPTFLCIHGNHEKRPHTIKSYKLKTWNEGQIWYEEKYPNVLFAKDGEIYNIENKKFIAIGGAYSVDKFYRIESNYNWWPDEQPNDEIKQYVEKQLNSKKIDYILSHTCPNKYIPREMFISGINQLTVDNSTEEWLDKIENNYDYLKWFCGHWHTNKKIDNMVFLFEYYEVLH